MATFTICLKTRACIILWFLLAPVAHSWNLGPLHIIGTGFLIILIKNLVKRQQGDVSAYSIFIEDFRELPGTLNVDLLDRDIRAICILLHIPLRIYFRGSTESVESYFFPLPPIRRAFAFPPPHPKGKGQTLILSPSTSMIHQGYLVFCIFLFTVFISGTSSDSHVVSSFNRSSFPSGFVFGTATSSYQVEGAANEGGRGPSIWDTFTQKHPEKIKDRSSGNVAIDAYHRYKENVRLMKDLGVDAYRFSISWSRILPKGKLSGGINQAGVEYYNNLINELLSKGIQPYVTIFHWDLPQSLEDKYLGFLSPLIVDDFRDYAELCFKLFGDRVKHWITLNEPRSYSVKGYSEGVFAPGRCSPWEAGRCSHGDSSREPYIVAHNQLLSHAAAVKVYRDKYQALQQGKIGITLITTWYLPYTHSKEDLDAADRAIDFNFGWFMEPITEGDYPFTMRALAGDRLPQFTREQSEMLKGSFDFLGLNYYTANYANSIPLSAKVNVSYSGDIHANQTGECHGKLIGPQAASNWLFIYPGGILKLLHYIKNKYNNPTIYITENGVDEVNNYGKEPMNTLLKDSYRINYYTQHLLNVQRAVREGVNVKGYFAWSMFDNFEWADGYTVRFGLYFVDFKTLKRYPKSSALWFNKFLKNN